MKRAHVHSAGNSIAIAACVSTLPAAGAGERALRVIPAGLFRARDGRPQGVPAWRIDREIAERIIARVAAKTDDLVVDYEHQTLHAEANGQPAPAAGWFKRLEWRDDGLYAADFRLTAKAKAAVDEQEYRYFSPVFSYDTRTGEVLDVLMGALTNYAAVDGLDDLVARAAARFSFTPQQEDSMNKELAKLLDLKEGASEEEIQQAVIALKSKAETAVAAATASVAAAAAPDPARYVPVEVVTDLQAEVAALRGQVDGREVDELVRTALAGGKLLPAMETWARDLGKKDVAALKAFIGAAVPVAALGGTQTGGRAAAGGASGELGEEALAVCRQLGVDPAEYKKTAAAA